MGNAKQGHLSEAAMDADAMRSALADDAVPENEIDAAFEGDLPEAEPEPTTALARPSGAAAVQSTGSVKSDLASAWGIEPDYVTKILLSKIVKPRSDFQPTGVHLTQACIIAHRHGLNPLLNHIYFFISRDGQSVIPVVGVDGWAHIAARSGRLTGFDFQFVTDENGALAACECTVWLRDCDKPFRNTEWLGECRRNTDPWKNQPRRMLRNRAFCQTVRLALGIGGIYDEDDAREVVDGGRPTRAQVIESSIDGIEDE